MSTSDSTLTPYMILPPIGFLSAVVTIAELRFILIALPGQQKKPWAYSKFSHAVPRVGKTQISGRTSLLIAYGLPFALCVAYLFYKHYKQVDNGYIITKLFNGDFNSIQTEEWQSILPHLMCILHYGKRLFETLFIHIFSNQNELDAALNIGINYSIGTMGSLYFQSMVDPSYYKDTANNNYNGLLSSLTLGTIMYGVGLLGNFIHHYILRRNRLENDKKKNDEKGYNKYVIPEGGLFSICWTPHYLFELIGWYGLGITSKHLTFHLLCGTYTSYLIGRAIATKKWYQKKFETCPDRYALVPFVL